MSHDVLNLNQYDTIKQHGLGWLTIDDSFEFVGYPWSTYSNILVATYDSCLGWSAELGFLEAIWYIPTYQINPVTYIISGKDWDYE